MSLQEVTKQRASNAELRRNVEELSDKLEAAEKLANAERAGAKAVERESKLAKDWEVEEISRLEREVMQASSSTHSFCLLPFMPH